MWTAARPATGRQPDPPAKGSNRDAGQNPRHFAKVSNRRHRHSTIEQHQPTRPPDLPHWAWETGLLTVHVAAYLTAALLVLSPVRALVFIAVQQGLFGVYLGSSFAPSVGPGREHERAALSGARTGETGQKTGRTGGRTAR
jgi:hypothetical protein